MYLINLRIVCIFCTVLALFISSVVMNTWKSIKACSAAEKWDYLYLAIMYVHTSSCRIYYDICDPLLLLKEARQMLLQ